MTTVISMCSTDHADVWKLTSELLPLNVKADRYQVFVPETEIEIFKLITNPKIEIHSQESLGSDFQVKLKQKLEQEENSNRLGWYLQQFYKIMALINVQDEVVVIWDADCVPVQSIEITDTAGKIIYVNSSREFHEPYFENIKRLLGMQRKQNFSFVIPSFPMRKQWIMEFIQHIETLHQMKWYDAIIESTDLSLLSGFSETETMGTFVANTYSGLWSNRQGTWERFGRSRFGSADRFDPKQMTELGKREKLEIITFENWDRGLIRKIQSKFFRRRI